MTHEPLQLKRLVWAFPVLLALLASQNVLQNGYGWDDENIIRLYQPPDRWLDHFHFNPELGRDNTPYFRPVIAFSYYMDYLLWGKNPFGYHLSVWIAHILNTALVFFLVRAVMRGGRCRSGEMTDEISEQNATRITEIVPPVIAASLFAVHPAHAEAVAWIAGRSDVFCATFILSSVIWYIQFRLSDRRRFLVLSMMAFFLSLLTKETAIGLAILFPVYDAMDSKRGRFGLLRRIAMRFSAPLAVLALYFWVRIDRIQYPFGGAATLGLLPDPSEPAAFRVISAFGYYLAMILMPYPHRPFIPSVPTSGAVLFMSVLLLLIAAASLTEGWVRQRRAVTMGFIWTLATLIPAVGAAALNLASAPLSERQVYIPSIGILIVTAWLFGMIPSTTRQRFLAPATALGIIVVVIVGLMSWETWKRNEAWRDSVTFWKIASASASESGYPLRALGVQYELRGESDKAERFYQEAVHVDEETLGPNHPEVAATLNNLAVLYYSQGRYTEADLLYRRILTISEKSSGLQRGDVAINFHNWAVLYRDQGRYAEAEQLFRRAIEIQEGVSGSSHPAVAASLEQMGRLYTIWGRYPSAEPLFKRALEIWEKTVGPESPAVSANLEGYAELLRKTGREAEAEKMESRAKAIREKQARKN